MTEKEEKAYLRGQRSSYVEILRVAVGRLGATHSQTAEAWRVERAEIVTCGGTCRKTCRWAR